MEEMNNRCNKRRDKRNGLITYILVFLLSVALYVVLLWVDKAAPFGSRSFLYDDAYVQYDNMLRTFIGFIHSPDKSGFMWNRGLGTDFYLNAIYYMLSPFNLIAVLMGESHVAAALTIMIILKCSLISVAGVYYFRNTVFNKINSAVNSAVSSVVIPAVFGIAFGFCGYIMAYGHHVIWLGGLILMPVLAIAIEKLDYDKKIVPYTLLLAFIIIVNFYYAVYVCLFAVFYFLLLNRESFKEFLRCAGRFALCSVIAAMMAGFVIVPAFVSIRNAGASMLGLDTPGNNVWGSITGYINSFFPACDIQTGYLYSNNNYCGSIALILLGMFFVCGYIGIKDKIKYAIELVTLILAANFLYLNYVFHGFVVPHGMGNRFAIILTFIVLNAAFRVMIRYVELRMRDVVAGIVSVVALLAVVLLFNGKLEQPMGYLIYILVVFLAGTAFVLYKRKSIKAGALIGFISLLWVGEIIANTLITMPDITRDESLDSYILFDRWNDDYDSLPLADGERKTALVNESYTPASETDWYSSMINGYMTEAYATMGLSHFDNVQCIYDGTTPLTALMYNVRYIISNGMAVNGGYHSIKEGDGYTVYEVDMLADMGFMADEDIVNWQCDGTPAENQNEFAERAFNIKDTTENVLTDSGQDSLEQWHLFNEITENDMSELQVSCNSCEITRTGEGVYEYTTNTTFTPNIVYDFVAAKDMDLYVYSTDTREQTVMVKVDKKTVAESGYFSSGNFVHGGIIKKGQSVRVILYGGAPLGETAEKTVKFYDFNNELWDSIKDGFTEQTLEFDGYEGNAFKGHIDVTDAGVLYLAFPYNEGFTIEIDGEPAEKLLLGKGNMGVRLDTGYHDIRIVYRTPGVMAGIILSCVGIILFAVLASIGKKLLK